MIREWLEVTDGGALSEEIDFQLQRSKINKRLEEI
jgi:hypothetical protein